MTQHYDLIIIGTGAGGGTLAYALAPTGKRILLLERGDYIPQEAANWDPRSLLIDGRYRTDERWRDRQGNSFQPSLYHRVGGSTKVYGAALLRLREQDFDAIAHADGISPAWDLSYADFEPYYTEAEHLYRVHGDRGSDPIEPATSAEFPFPALPHEPRIQAVADRLQQLGLRPFSLPMAIDRWLADPVHSPCIVCGTCDGYPCLVNAKADAQTCCVTPALQYETVTLLTHAQAERLIADPSGRRIQAVEVTVNGTPQRFSADHVVVSCGAVNSAALLLRSACETHPHGMANSSGLVGRQLMKHGVTKFYAIGPQRNETVFQKTLAINDFYGASSYSPFPLGHVHLMGKARWETVRTDSPRWVPNRVLQWLAQRSVDWWMQTEDLPDPNNRVTVDANGTITVHYQPNNQTAHQTFRRLFKTILHRAGFPLVLEVPVPLSVMNHQMGTCRFGRDPHTSVLDLNCRAHDLENLYVVDSSFFPSSSAVNPTLTIAANALRVARHLKESFAAAKPLE